MSRITKYMDNLFYPGSRRDWDDEYFGQVLKEKINPNYCCLDYGAGRGNVEQMNLKNVAKFVAGVDPDKAIFNNPYLNEAKRLDLKDNIIPYDDNVFDVVFSDNVMEHVQNPDIILKEILRVLKPGGLFLSKTPNKWHYMPTIARLTPLWFHRFYNELRGRNFIDTFPTVYKFNSKKAVNKCANQSGFLINRIQFIEGRPEYLRLTALTYLFGLLYERAVNLTNILAPFRCVMISELEKPSE